jgi:hypothetical protein
MTRSKKSPREFDVRFGGEYCLKLFFGCRENAVGRVVSSVYDLDISQSRDLLFRSKLFAANRNDACLS